MQVHQPTHVVTLGVYECDTGLASHRQMWIRSGPFDSPSDLADLMVQDLRVGTEAVEVIDRRESSHRRGQHTSPWEQLRLL